MSPISAQRPYQVDYVTPTLKESQGDPTGTVGLRALLGSFIKYDNGMRMTAVLRAVCFSGFFASLAMFLFLLEASPRDGVFLYVISALAIPLFTILAPISWGMHYRIRRRRNLLARDFFTLGFRVDPQQRLVTNSAHPQVIVDITVQPLPSYTE